MNENATQSHTDKCLADLCIASNHGQIAGVELTLHEWQRQRDCPTQARVLLAACLSRRGKHDEAATILQNAERSRPVTDDAMMMVVIVRVMVMTMMLDDDKNEGDEDGGNGSDDDGGDENDDELVKRWLL